jgi:hypothetical protein
MSQQSGGAEQQASVDSQRRAIEKYYRRNNLVLVHFFADKARSGFTTVRRDGLWNVTFWRGEFAKRWGCIDQPYP